MTRKLIVLSFTLFLIGLAACKAKIEATNMVGNDIDSLQAFYRPSVV